MGESRNSAAKSTLRGRYAARSGGLAALALSVVCSGCQKPADRAEGPKRSEPAVASRPETETPAPPPAAPPKNPEGAWLVDATHELGLPASTKPWPDGLYLTPEITPGGVGLFDFDADGDLDIYQVRHGEPAEMPDSFKAPAPNRLFRQESDGRFVEVEGAAGLADDGYGHGCAVGDVDNDGDLDVFVTNYGPNRLYLNEGGSFRDATASSGIEGDRWSSASAFFDYDRDGDLDLFVVNFGVFDPSRRCGTSTNPNDSDYCGPHLFDGVTDRLYRNDGDGRFTDVSREAGITTPARGWGVLCVDLTGDGWADIYVCNDEEPNQFWVSDGEGGFVDDGMFLGCAVNGDGRVEASMGVALGDVNGDARFDLFMTHVASETNTLYTLGEGGLYDDASPGSGASGVDLPYTGWGCALADVDLDADLDMLVANGRVAVGPVLPGAGLGTYWNRYAEPNLLFLNDGRGRFSVAPTEAGVFATRPDLARGMAVGDLDDDGDLDFVTNGIDNRLIFYRNDAPNPGRHWLRLRVVDGPRDAIGATVRLTAAGRQQARYVLRSYSYLASNDSRVHFGLGDNAAVESVEVTWVDGETERFSIDGVDREVLLRRGDGAAVAAAERTRR